MRNPADVIDELRRRFTADDWGFLENHQGFQRVLPAINNSDGLEMACLLGHELCDLRNQRLGTPPASPPETAS